MSLPGAQAIAVTSQQALAALREEINAVRKGLEAARSARVGLVDGGTMANVLEALQTAAEAATAANGRLIKSHEDLMNMHYAGLRGEPIFEPSSLDGDTKEVESKDEDAQQSCSVTDAQQRSEADLKRWALPQDEGVARVAAALAANSLEAPTAAAAAFAAAEDAARRRHARQLSAVGGAEELDADAGVWYPWRPDASIMDVEQAKCKEALTKRIGNTKGFDFSMFHQDMWRRAHQRAEAMLAEQQAGIYCYRDSMPKPQAKVPGCLQVKCRSVKVNTEEKINRCYQAMAAACGADRNGFLLGASLGRFITLAKDKSDAPEAKHGGDIGWVVKGKLDPRVEEVIFNTPKGACSPPFRVALASFHLIFVEDRR